MPATRVSHILIALAFAASSATGFALAPRQSQIAAGCTPNFSGHPVSVIYAGPNGLEELAPASDAVGANVITRPLSARTPEFLIENSGHFPTSYLIKDQANHELVAYATAIPRADAAIKLNPVDNTGKDERQYWLLSCTTCASPSFPVPPGGVFGTSCQIASSALGLCVQRTGVSGEPPVLAPCNDDEGNQRFNFLREYL
ncbi:hypothetical protein C8R46DRAFT_1285068 [Mycena filopes]|nr:hypothetical protein C8R46DRAFT_1285068 [Mycena filopes]